MVIRTILAILASASAAWAAAPAEGDNPVIAAESRYPGGIPSTAAKIGTVPHEGLQVSGTATRSALCLNGLWRFSPADEGRDVVHGGPWGTIPVPGAWSSRARWQTPVGGGEGYAPHYGSLDGTAVGWYSRRVEIPADFAGRQVAVEFSDVTNWARVFANGHPAGTIYRAGRVDITEYVQPGAACTLAVLVAATAEADAEAAFAQPAAGTGAAEYPGLTGDVFLTASPAGAQVAGALVRTSVAESGWSVRSDLRQLAPGKAYLVRATAVDAEGNPAAVLEQAFTAQSGEETVELSGAWASPRLWEPSDPHLYECRVHLLEPQLPTGDASSGNAAETDRLLDEYLDSFGFREFRIEGGDFVFNGRRLRLRPSLFQGGWQPFYHLSPPLIRAQLAGAKAEGFNAVQYWPSRFFGAFQQLADEADRQGILLILPLESMLPYRSEMAQGRVDEVWRREVERQVQYLGNHPSIVMWGVSPNVFGTRRWPRFVEEESAEYAWQRSLRPATELALTIHREIDPTRPVFFHGSDAGEVATPNMYLNMMPLQEQKEFLSLWASRKDFPLMMIECGLPFFPSITRWKRVGFPWDQGAPFATEYAAGYLGPAAYDLETEAYVKRIAAKFWGNEAYASFHNGDEPNREPQFQPVAAAFARERWRSWRTWGISGGMLPWEFQRMSYDKGPEFFTPYTEGTLAVGPRSVPGIWPATMRVGDLVPWTVSTDEEQPRFARAYTVAGEALLANNQSLLVYLGGPGEAHTSTARNFYGGQTLRRDVIAIYDGDVPGHRTVALQWTANLAGDLLDAGTAEIDVPPGEDVRVPLAIALPEVGQRSEGSIEITVDGASADRWSFAVFPRTEPPQPEPTLRLIDPEGLTAAMLAERGIAFQSWDGTWQPGDILLVGRQALSAGRIIDLDLPAAVERGLRVILFAQDAEFWEQRMNWRTSWHVSRQFFQPAVGAAELEGLADEDFSHWHAAGTLLPETYEYPPEVVAEYPPPQPIWHWGNSHAVATVALETPHFGGFTPLLTGEFDLAYSPLLELRLGEGLVILVQLNLEENAGLDPAADAALDAVLALAARELSQQPALLLFDGANATACRRHLDQGGNVLAAGLDAEALAQLATELAISISVETSSMRGASSLPDWASLRGVSRADVHWRGFIDVLRITELAGGEIAAEGLLGQVRVGEGKLFLCQVHPDLFPTGMRQHLQRPHEFDRRPELLSERTYLRLSRWRAQRLIGQLAANLGAEPAREAGIFLDGLCTPQSVPPAIDLSHERWLAREAPPGAGEENGYYAAELADTSAWEAATVPHRFRPPAPREATRTSFNAPTTVWFRRTFDAPADMIGQAAAVELFVPSTQAVYVYLNGEELPRTQETRHTFGRGRYYFIPRGLLAEQNTLVIRVRTFFGTGGLPHGPLQIVGRPQSPFYHEDYDADDNPFRWYPW